MILCLCDLNSHMHSMEAYSISRCILKQYHKHSFPLLYTVKEGVGNPSAKLGWFELKVMRCKADTVPKEDGGDETTG